MKLNPDCVRAVLLAVEDCPFNETLNLEKLSAKLPKYETEELWYTCLKLAEGDLLEIVTVPMMRSAMPGIKQITCMTYNGHEFLNTVRNPKIYKIAKGACTKGGALTLELLMEAAKVAASAAVTAAL